MAGMHPRVRLHQVAFMSEPVDAFIGHCRALGIEKTTLVTQLLMQDGALEETRRALSASEVAATTVNHVFAVHPNLSEDRGDAARGLDAAIDIAQTLGAEQLYVLTGGRGSYSWEQAAARVATLIAPCLERADAAGLSLWFTAPRRRRTGTCARRLRPARAGRPRRTVH